jgi:sigma-E factor negative regulatory protein RseB
MVVANETFNYQGTLVHMCGGTMDIVQIVHRVNRGKVTERLTAQATGGRQIIRKADVVMCILPDQKKVMVEQRSVEVSPIGAQIDNFPSFSTIDPSLYDVAMMGVDRVADRETMIIAITPVDTFRYGYRLWLDRLTALPLKFELVDDAGQALEQGVFTEIEFHESLSEEDVAPTIETDEFEWQRSAVVSNGGRIVDPRADHKALMQEPALSHWRVTVSPPGFELTFAQSRLAEGAPMPVEQLVYSDGLATISVFIEPKAEAADAVEGSSQIGATNAYTTISNDYLITAMGGVPIETVQMVALSVTAR